MCDDSASLPSEQDPPGYYDSDTVPCDLCGTSENVNAAIFLDGAEIFIRKGNRGVICVGCASLVSRAYAECCHAAGVCEHGVNDGDYCETCNAAYKRTQQEN